VTRFFQIRDNNKPVNQRLYSTFDEATAVLVKGYPSQCEVVELDTPGGAVVRRYTFAQCEEFVRTTGGNP
jgi:hypothetical protein